MPSDATTDLHRQRPADGLIPAEASDRSFPAGAGLALGVLLGTAIWGGIIALFLAL